MAGLLYYMYEVKIMKKYLLKNKNKMYIACCFYPFIFSLNTWLIFKIEYVYRHSEKALSYFIQYSFLTGCIVSITLVFIIMSIADNVRLLPFFSLADILFIIGIPIIKTLPTNIFLTALELIMVVFIITVGSYSLSYGLATVLDSLGELRISKFNISAAWIGFLGTVISALIGLLKR